MRAGKLLMSLLICLFAQTAKSENAWVTDDESREAFAQIYAGVGKELSDLAFQGRNLFRQSWVIPPASDIDSAGLGPLYNQLSCLACHPKNGRGMPPETPDQMMRSMLVRLSLPGSNEHGGPRPHPVYGDQLNEQGIPGIPGEGRVRVSYQEIVRMLPDGETIHLRRPIYTFTDLQYGPLEPEILYSPRIGPPVFGLGLLEAVSDSAIMQLAERGRQQGVNGRPNWVWDSEKQQKTIGRFGLKANVAKLKQQIAGAFIGDMSITSSLHPIENCSLTQTACQQAPSARQPELDDRQLKAVLTYLRLLQVPAKRAADDSMVQQGERLFVSTGCAACHSPSLQTGDFPEMPALSQQTLHPYTDLLLHDMGEELADDRPDFEASARDWRTPPLWGIGLIKKINGHSTFLHDGRARNKMEAILWHGGEAQFVRTRFEQLPSLERRSIIRFLESL
ncbi:di-heme oxidoredictase family protein [Methylicorpusculum sp.]|uniref:di-heme oxidoreductase family protein n=1 Tax=Methylicorpusculum sp. TaxID=2713644 RepID=UPI00271CC812|nr:di-heme oxidoredictase family protein [Methylicorpusculum sp.]MDO8845655.1 di-heme oxidoredictase family protein [Methylicorpusculum sp.]